MRAQNILRIMILFFICMAVVPVAIVASVNDDNAYDVNKIPSGFRKNSSSVVRKYIKRFEVEDENSAELEVVYAVTIFNKDGRDDGVIQLGYNKSINIDDLDGTVYDAQGNEVADLGDSDIRDFPAFDGYSLYQDERWRIASLYYDRYPYTVEYKYTIEYDGYINWPGWQSRESIDPVEESRFEVVTPPDYNLRYWCNRDSTIHPTVLTNAGSKSYTWAVKNQPELSKDAVDEDDEDIAVIVKIAPTVFELYDHPGSMRTWKEFGVWAYMLYMGKDRFDDSVKTEIKSLFKPDDSLPAKVDKLYRYMQGRTRYVSIQLGIGGWQPFDAMFVHEKGYGDCKALSNYMVALLKQADITAYPVLINSGNDRHPLIYDFPANQFDHVIVCVPNAKDTIWLECTNPIMPTGAISWSTENRYALMLTPSGGVIVSTPGTTSSENLQNRFAEVTINLKGTAETLVTTVSSGDQGTSVRNSINNRTPEEIEKWIIKKLNSPSPELKSYTVSGVTEHYDSVVVKIQANLRNYASVSGNRIFFKPDLMDRRILAPADIDKRLSPVRYLYPYLDQDSIKYKIPEGYALESLPKEMELKTSFGEFKCSTSKISDNELVFKRSLKIDTYSIPAEQYSEYRDFFSKIVKADKAQVVLVKKQ